MSTAVWHGVRRLHRWWDRLAVYLPIMLMAMLAMLSYWLVRTAPLVLDPPAQRATSHVPDYQMYDFTVRVFDDQGLLKSELSGRQGRHFPDTDTVEVDGVRVRTLHANGRVTSARAERGLSNADGSEVQLMGQAVVVREAHVPARGPAQERQELRSEFLHLYADTETIRTHRPVELLRGSRDRFTAERMDYDNLDRVMRLQGRVRGEIAPRQTQR